MRGTSGEWKVAFHLVFSFTSVTGLVQPCFNHEVINLIASRPTNPRKSSCCLVVTFSVRENVYQSGRVLSQLCGNKCQKFEKKTASNLGL